jgi:hypothetical protein
MNPEARLYKPQVIHDRVNVTTVIISLSYIDKETFT